MTEPRPATHARQGDGVMGTHRLLTFFLSLRTIMLISSAGALVGSLLMFLQGGVFLHEAWHTILAEGDAVQKQVTVPVLEAVDSFLFGIVLVIFAYGIAIGFILTLPKGYGERQPTWMKVGGLGQLKTNPCRGGHRRADRDLRPHHRRGEWSIAMVDAGAAGVFYLADRSGSAHDRARRREASKRKRGGGRRALALLMTERL